MLGAVEQASRSVHARMSWFLKNSEGVVVRHRQLEGDNSRLMRSNRVNFNEIGLDIFLLGIQDRIEQALFSLCGGQNAV